MLDRNSAWCCKGDEIVNEKWRLKSCILKYFADKTKTLAANNANTTSAQSASVAVTAPSVAGGQGAPTSPVKKVKENTFLFSIISQSYDFLFLFSV